MADLAGFKPALPGNLGGGEGSGVKRPFNGLVFDRPVSGYPHAAIRLGDYKLVKF